MDTNVIIAIVAVVVIAALLAIGGWWFGKSRKSAVSKSTEAAKAKADARLATEKSAAQSAAASAENAEKTKETAESAATEAVESATSSATPESPVATEPTPVGSAVTESATPAVETPEAAGTRMQRLKARLSKSGNPFGKALFNILAKDQLSEADWEDVEDTLLLADVGAEASEQLVEELRNDARIAGQSDPAEVRAALKDKLLKLVGIDTDRRLNANKEGANKPSVIIMVGVNGTGKTTTAGKLSRLLVSEGKQVMLGAADTFRAAAADQLETWGAKVGVPVVRSDKDGADPASVAFEASAKAKEENADVLIIDTAGRLQNKSNLMDELGKIRRVTEKNLPVDEVLLVLDATTGQNGMTQAKVFAEAIGITGVVLSKLDGSAKGGIVISVQKELGVPVKLVGLGEGPDDLAPFDPEGFVDGILA
ncbi:signal recognition particle-docking protein FtsY [Bifidobacterium adolescentis]|uniref:signal recognition particle-docking protein FtsY n=1 Tax=Bifidobacterium adolescentis TaxID=1680 RepID=UPI00189A177E|nr:signal recognition particle-docking protein FtsY [Bifidobacterium adolescentis]MDB1503914.1 signal recognition particle-docking protein FtsY [Bifidobacterium adolescentis]